MATIWENINFGLNAFDDDDEFPPPPDVPRLEGVVDAVIFAAVVAPPALTVAPVVPTEVGPGMLVRRSDIIFCVLVASRKSCPADASVPVRKIQKVIGLLRVDGKKIQALVGSFNVVDVFVRVKGRRR